MKLPHGSAAAAAAAAADCWTGAPHALAPPHAAVLFGMAGATGGLEAENSDIMSFFTSFLGGDVVAAEVAGAGEWKSREKRSSTAGVGAGGAGGGAGDCEGADDGDAVDGEALARLPLIIAVERRGCAVRLPALAGD